MGIFSTKKKYFTNTQFSRLIPDNSIPDVLRVVAASTIATDISMPDALFNNALYGGHRKFEDMWKFAKTPKEEGGYTRALPSAWIRDSGESYDAVQTYLTSAGLLPNDHTLQYVRYAPINNFHLAWEYLVKNLKYNWVTSEIVAFSEYFAAYGKPVNVVLNKLIVVYPFSPEDPISLSGIEQWPSGIPGAAPVLLETKMDVDAICGVEIHWSYASTEGAAVTTGMNFLDLSVHDTENGYEVEWYQALISNATNTVHTYWSYNPELGTIPSLSNLFDPDFTEASADWADEYWPIALWRSNKDAQHNNEPNASSSQTLLEHIGIDFKDIGKELSNDDDISHVVQQAAFFMAIPCDSQHELDIEYLYKYFNNVYDRLPTAAQKTGISALEKSLFFSESKISDGYALDIHEADFRLVLSFRGMLRRLLTVKDAVPGTFTNTSEIQVVDTEDQYYYFRGLKLPIFSDTAAPNTRIYSYCIYPGIVQEIRILDLNLKYDIINKKNGSVNGGSESGLCLIPLSHAITEQFAHFDQEVLYYRSCMMVLNSVQVQKQRFYERGWFKVVSIVIIVAVMYFSGGALGWQAAAIEAGVGATTLAIATIWLTNVVTALAIGYAISYGLAKVAEVIGGELALILAVIVVVVAAYSGYTNTTIMGKITAKDLLMVANGLGEGSAADMAARSAELQDEYLANLAEYKEQFEALDAIDKALDLTPSLNPSAFIGFSPFFIPAEKPQDYFYRTLDVGNIGVEVFKINENFVENSLRLPTLAQTIGV